MSLIELFAIEPPVQQVKHLNEDLRGSHIPSSLDHSLT
jgi:hypothetical protein